VSWAGTWNTPWPERDGNRTAAPLSLTQAGSDVTGTCMFAYPGEGPYTGHLNGTANGSTLAGTYSESGEDVGYFLFVLSDDTGSFTGRWVHAENQSELAGSRFWWNGTRS
jgi:hypothetical protein